MNLHAKLTGIIFILFAACFLYIGASDYSCPVSGTARSELNRESSRSSRTSFFSEAIEDIDQIRQIENEEAKRLKKVRKPWFPLQLLPSTSSLYSECAISAERIRPASQFSCDCSHKLKFTILRL